MTITAKLVEVEQGTDEWFALRLGRLTMSRAADIRAGKDTKRYRAYKTELARELLGYQEEPDDPPWFRHGREMEPYARGEYSYHANRDVTADLFAIHPEYDWVACSPDGIWTPGHDGAIEIKCRETPAKFHRVVENLIRNRRPEPNYHWQMQGQMWVLGLDEIHYVNYCHADRVEDRLSHVFTVRRDNAMIAELERRCLELMIEAYQLAQEEMPKELAQ